MGSARIAILSAALLTGLAAAPSAAGQEEGVSVTVQVTNMRNTDGVVRACMTRDEERFPRCQNSDLGYRVVVPAGEATTLRFRNVAPGTYAIALLHDENENGRADRALGMMPTEGFGFSRDARVRMGPPDFDDAAIEVGTSAVQQTIRMRYML
ncbi:DUF2141 domain-containing protein [Aurantiacibacter sediminis]|uniref:DUF2141 domain-containing protein n=1 Tax=Aurantiacibacter sediminis TaxID=2793064 RepID=A0ABS0N054_9SPHN|nr:DUF2141 domain-containing protein [Aurantiacibacter sediminis]MBH5321334.1 DUF2141 domain-containing protein [Aurantiacibacter sediminis]